MRIDWWFCLRDGICGDRWDGMGDGSDGGSASFGLGRWSSSRLETGGLASAVFVFPLFGCFCFGYHGARIDKD